MSQPAMAVTAPHEGLGAQLGKLPRAFWMLNVMEMFERLAYYGVRVVIPIYIAQADEIHGLHFTQSQKGFIFMLWALVQTGMRTESNGEFRLGLLRVWPRTGPRQGLELDRESLRIS